LFTRLEKGDFVLIAAPDFRELPDPTGERRFHYAGLAGSGMSGLAQFHVMQGGHASGSDRPFDRGERASLKAQLENLGITVMPQAGRGSGAACAALVSRSAA